ncbi:DUF2194 domain-containing protein [Metabacillus fastidiosus]|uniref:DUF2194 domain-containing protein n=1 Tax=Metabacillus fastidiosus TaxID=1458 RepID=UPI002E20E794|nr:DUF2194 domain-containing protein [Metabacillus fastidiosus]
MNSKFSLERGIYVMGVFIIVIGVLFLFVRSDAVLKFRYFSEQNEDVLFFQESLDGYEKPSYLVLTGTDHKELSESLRIRLENMGKQVKIQPLSVIRSMEDMKEFNSVIVATEQLDVLKDANVLLDFTKSGGSLFFAVRPSPSPVLSAMYQHLGMVEAGNFIETTGIKLEHPLVGKNGRTLFQSDRILNSSLSVRLSPDAKLYASSASGIPIFWTKQYGEGQFIIFNGTMFVSTVEQALFVKGIQLASDEVMTPIVNAHVTELGSFPFAVPDGRSLSEGYTNRDYYRFVVWPELQRIEAKYDLNYTASYLSPKDEVIMQGEASRSQEDLRLYGRELLRMGGELAIQEAVYLNEKERTAVYKDSISRIAEALPSYKVRSTVIPALNKNKIEWESKNIVLTPEFYVKKMGDNVILPKTIEGFAPDVYAQWLALNEIAVSGYYAHTVYPQLFLQGKNIEESFDAFVSFQQQMKREAPWLKNLTLSKAADAAYTYINSDLYEERNGNMITFYATTMRDKAYYYFSSRQSIVSTENCEVEKVGENLYIVEAHKLRFSIRLDGAK